MAWLGLGSEVWAFGLRTAAEPTSYPGLCSIYLMPEKPLVSQFAATLCLDFGSSVLFRCAIWPSRLCYNRVWYMYRLQEVSWF